MKSHLHNGSRRRWFPVRTALAAGLCFCVLSPVAADMKFTGLDARLESNVRILTPLASTDCNSAPWRVERLFRNADAEIIKALQALGHYSPTIEKTFRWTDDCWDAEFTIDPGPPVRYRQVAIEIDGPAATDPAFLAQLVADRPEEGAILDHGAYTRFKNSLVRAAEHAGYFDADFDRSKVTVDPATQAADLEIRFVGGAKYRFGEIAFTEGIVRRQLLEGYTDIVPGQPYSAKEISDLYEALGGSAYFETISIKTEPLDTENKTVPVHVRLTPANRRIYSAGGGYTTDTGPHAKLGFINQRINQRGHQLEAKLFASAVRSELNVAYRWPRKDPRNEWFNIATGVQSEDTDTSNHDTYKLGVMRSRKSGERWLETRYADFAYENFEVADQKSSSRLLILGTSYETAKSEILSRVQSGHRLSVDLRGASDSLGSDTTFLQLRAGGKWIHSFNDRTRVLARANLGATAKRDLEELPASVRFFAGGDRSVRGYDFKTLGPVNEDGEVIGGSHLVTASLEFDRAFGNKWAVAVFADTGSAFNGSAIDFSTGVGMGLRWYSPVGPIRVDVAHPLDNPDDSVRLHISLGPDL
jgi:translocation and assembly module TamA